MELSNDKYQDYKNMLMSYAYKKFYNIANDVDTDLEGLCDLAIVKSLNTYDESRGVNFMTLACNIFTNELLMQHRKIKRRPSIYSFDYEYHKDNDNRTNKALQLRDILVTNAVDYIDPREDYVSHFMDLINTMEFTMREKLILEAKIKGLHQREVATQLGVSQSYVSRLSKALFNRINRYCNGGVKRD